MAGRLYVDFCGEERVVAPGEVLSFGREADLDIDDNPYMHRVLGRFAHRSDNWWIHNAGTTISLNVFDRGIGELGGRRSGCKCRTDDGRAGGLLRRRPLAL